MNTNSLTLGSNPLITGVCVCEGISQYYTINFWLERVALIVFAVLLGAVLLSLMFYVLLFWLLPNRKSLGNLGREMLTKKNSD